MIAVIEALTFNLRIRVKGAYRQVFNLAQITVVAYLMGQVVDLLLGKLPTLLLIPVGAPSSCPTQ